MRLFGAQKVSLMGHCVQSLMKWGGVAGTISMYSCLKDCKQTYYLAQDHKRGIHLAQGPKEKDLNKPL